MIAALTFIIAALLAVLRGAPETAYARRLHATIVAPLAAALNRVRRGHVLLLVFLAVGIWFAGSEGAQFAAMALPDVAAWAAMVDVGALIDIGVAAIITVAMTPLRSLVGKPRPRRASSRPRAARTRPTRRCAANDDGKDRRAA